MKKINYVILSLIIALGVSSCDNTDFGDINDNPNGTMEPNPSGLLAGAIMEYATITGRDYLNRPTLYVQYQSQVTYTTESRYSENQASWYAYYVTILENLQQVISYAENPDNQGVDLNNQGAPENQIGVAKIMEAVVMKRVTDTYGDVPFSEGFAGLDNLTPAYDKQEDIYKTLISQVKEARDMMDESAAGPTGDILLDGNITKWKKFANSLLLQMSLQLSNQFPDPSGYAATEFNAALTDPNGVLEEVNDEPWFKYQNLASFQNPWTGNRTRDYFLSAEFVDALQGDDTEYNPTSNHTFDSRLSVYARSTTKEGVPYGYAGESGAGKNQMSIYFWDYKNFTSPLPAFTASYTYLMRAEAGAIGWTSEDAQAMLTTGIEKSYATLDYHYGTDISGDAEAYATARLADAASVGILQVIGEEKWVALYGQGFDAWAEWRRTGFPNLTPATDFLNSGEIPTRYDYPSEESGLNSSNYATGVSGLTPAEDVNTSHVWWDVPYPFD
ncbi:MAG: SusD/RagB family nutrient-binding outer membrane lipoprotein [Gillisia sp.]